jgi:hypothetical protein
MTPRNSQALGGVTFQPVFGTAPITHEPDGRMTSATTGSSRNSLSRPKNCEPM